MSVAGDLSGPIAQLLRVALAAFIIIHFLRRIIRVGTQAKIPPGQARRVRRDANAFRDEPPPPENPHLG
jgi:hypothetical protein